MILKFYLTLLFAPLILVLAGQDATDCFGGNDNLSNHCDYLNLNDPNDRSQTRSICTPKIHKSTNSIINPIIQSSSVFYHSQNDAIISLYDVLNVNQYHHCSKPGSTSANNEFRFHDLDNDKVIRIVNSNLVIDCKKIVVGDHIDSLIIKNSTVIIRTEEFVNLTSDYLIEENSKLIVIIKADNESNFSILDPDIKIYDNSAFRIFSNAVIRGYSKIIVGRPSPWESHPDSPDAYDYSSLKIYVQTLNWHNLQLARKSKSSILIRADKISNASESDNPEKLVISGEVRNGRFGTAFNANVMINAREYLNFFGVDVILDIGEAIGNIDVGTGIRKAGEVIFGGFSEAFTSDEIINDLDYEIGVLNYVLESGEFPYEVSWNLDYNEQCTTESRYFSCTEICAPNCSSFGYDNIEHNIHCNSVNFREIQSVKDHSLQNKDISIVAFPNPTQDFLNIKSKEETGPVFVEMFSLDGMYMKEWDFAELDKGVLLNFQDVPFDIYVIRIKNRNGELIKSFKILNDFR